jgi:uncharacterized membrane protein
MEKIKRYLITGFVVVVPIFLTFYVLLGIFSFADGILGRFLNVYLENSLGFYIPGLGFFIAIIFIFFTGLLATRFVGKKIISGIEKWFSNLPLINKVYPTLKQIILFISAQKEFGFKKVVLVEYPSKGIWSMGFLTNEHFDKISQLTNKEMVGVFMPSTPGPLTGYMIFLPKKEVKFLDISVSDALKIIISGGVFKPIN